MLKVPFHALCQVLQILRLVAAARAYKQALATLHHVNVSYGQREDHVYLPYNTQSHSTSIWSALLPNAQGQGPIASAIRIASKLRQQKWVPGFITHFLGKQLGGGRRKDEELAVKAVKVLDLLQHAIDLGHSDALYLLAHLSLVSVAVLSERGREINVAQSSLRTSISLPTPPSASSTSQSTLL